MDVKQVLVNIYNYIKSNKILLAVCGGLLAIIIILLCWLHSVNNKRTISEVNLKAATEELAELKTKNGDLLVEKQSYVTSINDLNKYLDISKQEVKDLQKSLDNKVLYISKLEGQINIKPTEIHDTTVVYKDSTIHFAFNFGDQWYSLSGESDIVSNIAHTKINSIAMEAPLKVGLTDDWQIFVTTSNPYVSFSDIDGALLDKSMYLKEQKKKHWNIGIQVGFGAQYGLMHKTFDYGPYIGAGISYGFGF